MTDHDLVFELAVQGDLIVYFKVHYLFQKGICQVSSSFGGSVAAPIVENQFAIDWQDDDGNTAHVVGTFTSGDQASGTVEYTDNVKKLCDTTMLLTWSAISPAALEAGTPNAPPATLAVAGLNGRWDGENSDGYQVYFDVVNEQITYLFFNFSVLTGGCSFSGAQGQVLDNAMIVDKSFSVDLTDDDGRAFTFSGSFISDNAATGTIHIKGSEGAFCGAFESEMTWNTQRAISQASSEPPTKTTIPLALATSTVAVDPLTVVQGFFDAYNAGDIDAALAFLDNRVLFSLGSATGKVGPSNLRAFLTEQKQKGITYTISNLKAVGTIVKFSVQASDGAAYSDSQAFVDAGRITLLALK